MIDKQLPKANIMNVDDSLNDSDLHNLKDHDIDNDMPDDNHNHHWLLVI